MPQVSKYPLDKDIESAIFKQFWISVSKLNNPKEVSSFFSDLLTDTEEVMLAKRFTTALLILRGKRPKSIKDTLHVSYSLVGSVASWVKNAKPETRKLLQSFIQGDSWSKLLDRIEELLDELPPAYRTDWRKAGQEKWERRKQRATRRALR